VGWLCATLTLITGSLWAHAAWGTWWTWEPRLTTAFILWCVYSGYLIARNSIDHPERRARLTAVLAIIGAADVPLVMMATRLFRGMHPVSPSMDPTMRLVLWLSVASFSFVFLWLLVQRRRQLGLAARLARLESTLEIDSACAEVQH
jgi:heme exporter protein C